MTKNAYLDYVHSFRGFAILNIVAIHAVAVALVIPLDWEADKTDPLYILNETLFHDSTIYFALISGLLFASILRSRGYQRFFRSKFFYVLCPYIFCTLVFSVMRWNSLGTGVLALPTDPTDYLSSILPNLARGEAQFTYWYIPVLLFMFAITPLLGKLADAKSYAAIPVWLIMFSPLLFSRPVFEVGVLQAGPGTLIYFSGAYTVGIFLGRRLEAQLDRISEYRSLILAVAVVASVVIATIMLNQIDRFGSFSLQESLFYVQKLSIAALVLLWLRARAENQPRWLTYFANEAFSIYFLHAFFIMLLAHVGWTFLRNPDFQPWTVYLGGPIYFVFALSLSMLVVYALRALLGKRSRLLIGS